MNTISMKLQADELIRLALQEDISSEDVTTNSVMKEAVEGEVQLICKQYCIVAGLDVYGIENVQEQCLLTAAVQNMKKIARVLSHLFCSTLSENLDAISNSSKFQNAIA